MHLWIFMYSILFYSFSLSLSLSHTHTHTHTHIHTHTHSQTSIHTHPWYKYSQLHIFRPSLLITERDESRPGEFFAQKSIFFFLPCFSPALSTSYLKNISVYIPLSLPIP